MALHQSNIDYLTTALLFYPSVTYVPYDIRHGLTHPSTSNCCLGSTLYFIFNRLLNGSIAGNICQSDGDMLVFQSFDWHFGAHWYLPLIGDRNGPYPCLYSKASKYFRRHGAVIKQAYFTNKFRIKQTIRRYCSSDRQLNLPKMSMPHTKTTKNRSVTSFY